MASVTVELRDQLMTAFRTAVCEKMGVTFFRHQAEWILAGDGLTLTMDEVEDGFPVQQSGGSIRRFATIPRNGGRARVLADLGAFKVGKSFGSGMWASGFAAIPGARVSLVGLEYDICTPEFDYIVEALLSQRGMNLPYEKYQNNPRTGNLFLELKNGVRYEAKSWERKDSLKGKEIDAYIYCEAFMLPGMESYSSVKQNLSARKGYAVFPTTPDRPWVEEFHLKGHGDFPDFLDWHCTCSVPRSSNHLTFDFKEMAQAREIMTSEKFAIAYEGKLGDYVGRVYNYQRGQAKFSRATHPFLFKGEGEGILNISIPDGWKIEAACDTGTFMAFVVAAVSPDGIVYVLWEEPNYHYRSHSIELREDTSVPQWATSVSATLARFGARGVWADKNSQFKRELANYSITLMGSDAKLERRTEVARSYFQHHQVLFAPWLTILPYEVENAQWPEEATLSGKFERLKKDDHTLDCLEHILSRHPRGENIRPQAPTTWANEQGFKQRNLSGNSHLGNN